MNVPLDHNCETCPAHAQLAQMGVSLGNYDHLVALAGNPNTGKSSVFNALTGLRQHVGNWTGKTVARAEGGYKYAGKSYKLVDLPARTRCCRRRRMRRSRATSCCSADPTAPLSSSTPRPLSAT
jgi:hypothetical protein